MLEFNEHYDIAALKLKDDTRIEFFELDTGTNLDYNDAVFFCGYQFVYGYSPHQYPFAVHSGHVTSFPDIIVGGERYPHIQVSSVNLCGNSDAPLFRAGSNTVVGVVNGYMYWESDNLACVDDSGGSRKINKGTRQIPLSISFATQLKTIQEHTHILNS